VIPGTHRRPKIHLLPSRETLLSTPWHCLGSIDDGRHHKVTLRPVLLDRCHFKSNSPLLVSLSTPIHFFSTNSFLLNFCSVPRYFFPILQIWEGTGMCGNNVFPSISVLFLVLLSYLACKILDCGEPFLIQRLEHADVTLLLSPLSPIKKQLNYMWS